MRFHLFEVLAVTCISGCSKKTKKSAEDQIQTFDMSRESPCTRFFNALIDQAQDQRQLLGRRVILVVNDKVLKNEETVFAEAMEAFKKSVAESQHPARCNGLIEKVSDGHQAWLAERKKTHLLELKAQRLSNQIRIRLETVKPDAVEVKRLLDELETFRKTSVSTLSVSETEEAELKRRIGEKTKPSGETVKYVLFLFVPKWKEFMGQTFGLDRLDKLKASSLAKIDSEICIIPETAGICAQARKEIEDAYDTRKAALAL
jgi:hypothetical protein